jgi:branched-chain amino acid transport system permease protein
VAVGLTLVFGVLNILNFAHGSLYAVGAYTAASAVDWYYGGNFGPAFLGYFLMLAAALLVAVALGPLLERSVLRLFYRRDEVVLVLVTYALFLILEDATKLIWGVDPYYAYEPYGLLGNVSLFGLSYVGYDFALVGAALVTGVLLWLGLNRTITGKVVLAVIHDRDISAAMGVNVTRVFSDVVSSLSVTSPLRRRRQVPQPAFLALLAMGSSISPCPSIRLRPFFGGADDAFPLQCCGAHP